jgi:hypothetical protein
LKKGRKNARRTSGHVDIRASKFLFIRKHRERVTPKEGDVDFDLITKYSFLPLTSKVIGYFKYF